MASEDENQLIRRSQLCTRVNPLNGLPKPPLTCAYHGEKVTGYFLILQTPLKPSLTCTFGS